MQHPLKFGQPRSGHELVAAGRRRLGAAALVGLEPRLHVEQNRRGVDVDGGELVNLIRGSTRVCQPG